MSLPRSAADITPEWLTDALRTSGTLDGQVTVTAVEQDAVASGIGFMGEVAMLGLRYDDGTAGPGRMVAKIPTQDPTVRGLLAPAKVFEREVRFYQDVAPRLGGLVPDCYLAALDSESDDFLLLLEDLSSMQVGDQLVGCSVDQASVALEALAAFHAEWWQNDALDELVWMPRMDDAGMKIGEQIYAASLPGFTEQFGSAIDPANEDLVARFGENVPQLLDRMAAMPNTVAHFDFRLDNLFFGDGQLRMIDFQTCSKGGGAYDVGYFLSQSLPSVDRRAHEDDLLRHYHDRLRAGGVAGYDLDELRRDYRVATLYSWIIPVFAIGTLDTSSERAIALWTEVVARSQAALIDHDVTDLLSV